ncbi:MAG: Dabb family protein [Pontiellaceae bacterium]
MFKHIVMWRLKPEVKEEDQLEMKRQLEALLDVVPSLKAIEVGLNIAKGDATYDVVLTTVFEDEVGFQAYATDPVHLEVVDFVRRLVCDRAVVDFKN